MSVTLIQKTLILVLLGSTNGKDNVDDNSQDIDLNFFQPLEDKILNRLLDADDGPMGKQIKELVAEYLLATAVESASNGPQDSSDILGRTLIQQNNYPPPVPQQPQIVYVYGTPPPTQNQNQRTQRTRHTKPPRTRRPDHHNNHHQSSEEKHTQPPIQPTYVQQQSPQYPPQYQPQQPSQISPVSKPLDIPQDQLGSQSSNSGLQTTLPQYQNMIYVQKPALTQNSTMYVSQEPPPPVQVVYLQATTVAGQTTGPTTTPRPRPSQEHVYNQVNNILDNVGRLNITGIVDQSLGIRAPAPTRNFVNGILNTVFCNPINRLLGRCRG